eukprot:TRINITY_DN8870_c0_g1_i1.p1 TRINITY_DN8870_c0_g1~~TRINITY_DN8870_c0_g1_i1.p1  ORF type:complete len:155 (+),score=31.96 TRINITY_DN8870_c0_g1_i1:43-465(+)
MKVFIRKGGKPGAGSKKTARRALFRQRRQERMGPPAELKDDAPNSAAEALQSEAADQWEDDVPAGAMADDNAGANETRGQVLQRHKREYKSLRQELRQLKKTKSSIPKKRKDDKKALSRDIREKLTELQRRHAEEAARFV